jgi:hypothetical protein
MNLIVLFFCLCFSFSLFTVSGIYVYGVASQHLTFKIKDLVTGKVFVFLME